MQTKCQQEFEKFAEFNGMNLALNNSDTVYKYEDEETEFQWGAWCAAWEAAQTQLITARNIYMLGYERGKKNADK